MNRVHILDCTLRDGGYCNQWKFGWDNARKIVKGLVKADIDIIECGFLSEKISYDKDVTKFTTVDELRSIIPENRSNKLFVAMINYGDYDAENLPQCDGTSIDGIRVAFHKKDMDEALKLCSAIKNKGYKVFIQAMVTLSYTDNEFLTLIKEVNLMEPYAFYIVDSFGMMKNRDLIRLFIWLNITYPNRFGSDSILIIICSLRILMHRLLLSFKPAAVLLLILLFMVWDAAQVI